MRPWLYNIILENRDGVRKADRDFREVYVGAGQEAEAEKAGMLGGGKTKPAGSSSISRDELVVEVGETS